MSEERFSPLRRAKSHDEELGTCFQCSRRNWRLLRISFSRLSLGLLNSNLAL